MVQEHKIDMEKKDIYSPSDIDFRITQIKRLIQRGGGDDLSEKVISDIMCGLERLQENALIIELNWHGEISDEAILRLAIASEGLMPDDKLNEAELLIKQKIHFSERMSKRYKVANKSISQEKEIN